MRYSSYIVVFIALLAASSSGADSIKMAIDDMAKTWPAQFKDADKLLAELKQLREAKADNNKIAEFQKRVLLRNPLLDFDKLLVVRTDKIGLPNNWESNSNIGKTGYNAELQQISIKNPNGVTPVYRTSNKAFIGDVDLHFDAGKALFSSIGTNGAWQVMELDLKTKQVRQVTQTKDKGVNNYDACYSPDGRIIFTSTAPYVAVPCVNGAAPVANAFRCNADGSGMEQLTFDQEHAWCP